MEIPASRGFGHIQGGKGGYPSRRAQSRALENGARSAFESGYDKINWHILAKSNEAIWFSQRSNWGHLYLYDLGTGAIKNQITTGDWRVLQLLHVDQTLRKLQFTGSCREPGDPYFTYLYSVNFDGSDLKLLTPMARWMITFPCRIPCWLFRR